MIFMEYQCIKCGETAINPEPGDPHFMRADGEECGGRLTYMGSWVPDEIPHPATVVEAATKIRATMEHFSHPDKPLNSEQQAVLTMVHYILGS